MMRNSKRLRTFYDLGLYLCLVSRNSQVCGLLRLHMTIVITHSKIACYS